MNMTNNEQEYGHTLEHEVLVNSFFEGMDAELVDKGMREMVSNFCEDVIWRACAIPPKKQALLAEELTKLIETAPEKMELRELQAVLLALLDKVEDEVSTLRKEDPNALYSPPGEADIATQKKTQPKPEATQAKAEKPKAMLPNPVVEGEEQPKHEQKEGSITEEAVTTTESNTEVVKNTDSVMIDTKEFFELQKNYTENEVIDERSPEEIWDLFCAQASSDDASKQPLPSEQQGIQEAKSTINTTPEEKTEKDSPVTDAPKVDAGANDAVAISNGETPKQGELTALTSSVDKTPRKNPMMPQAKEYARIIRTKVGTNPTFRESGSITKIAWAIARGEIQLTDLGEYKTYEEVITKVKDILGEDFMLQKSIHRKKFKKTIRTS